MLPLQGGSLFAIGFGLAFVAFGGYIVWRAVQAADVAVSVRLASETSPLEATPGTTTKVSGTVRADDESVRGPVSGDAVVAAHHTVERRHDDPEDGTSWLEAGTDNRVAPFLLEGEDNATVRVETDAQLYLTDRTATRESSLAVDPDTVPIDLDGQTRHEERVIEAGDEVTAYGTVADSNGNSPRLKAGEDPLIVIDDTSALPSITLAVLGAAFGAVFVLIGIGVGGQGLLSLVG